MGKVIDIKMNGYKKVRVIADGNKVIPSGVFSLPSQIGSFQTEAEANACLDGIKWAIEWFEGTVE